MNGFPILPWLVLVAVYFASGRLRGSSWALLAATAAGVFAAVFLEFTLAFTLGLAGFLATIALAAAALFAVMIVRRVRRSPRVLRQPYLTGT